VTSLRTDIVTEGKIKEILSDLAPDKINASIRTIELLIEMVTDPKQQMTLRSYAGSFLLEKFETNNQRIIVGQDKKIAIVYIDPLKSNPQLDANNTGLQTNLNTLISEKPKILDTIR
jgi:hypothetical protein